MSQALYRKWRPQTWDEVVGQEHIIQTLRNAVRGDRVAHAYLFAGPRGTGKTTTARVLAKAVNCLTDSLADRPCNRCRHCLAVNEGRFLDLIEIDAASNTSVEDVRDLRDKINFAPNEGRFKVYIVDEVHMLSTAAFNALLKTLEEPPAHAIFVLATTEVHKIPATVLSRCQRHEFRRLPVATIVGYLSEKLEAEGLHVEPGVLELVARQATGSLRDAISLLDQLASAGGLVTLSGAQQVMGTAAGEAVCDLVEALIRGDTSYGLTLINRALDAGTDPRQFARQIVDYLRSLLMARMGNAALLEVPSEVRAEMARQAEALDLPTLLGAMRGFNRAASEGRVGWQPALPLEMAFVETVQGLGEVEPSGGNPARRNGPDAEPPKGPVPNPSRESVEPRQTLPRPGGEEVLRVREGGPSAEVTFQSVLDRWREILGAAHRRDPRTQALLNSCRPLGLESGVLVLGFASDLLREKMEKGHSLSLAREALREVLGVPLDVRSALTSGPSAVGRSEDHTASLADDGMVATALRDLGAQVVDVRPVPPEDGA